MPDQQNIPGNNKPAAPDTNGSQYPLDRYNMSPDKQGDAQDKSPYYKSAAPEITLPKGGGALKGIDEKFSVNAVNGTAGLQVAFPLSPARSGFTPSLAISYSSGGGNSEFGLGWGLSLPAIQRRTDKLLPTYDDAHESDVFLLAGAEDMVPEQELADGVWQIKRTTVVLSTGTYTVTRYMPRIEGLYARIELIKKDGSDGSWWRVTTRDNITTYYGLTAEGRVTDPASELRIYKWLPQLVCDRKGNIQQYRYIAENTENVLNRAHENNRLNGTGVFVNTYLQKVQYCNNLPYFINADHTYEPEVPVAIDYLMEAVLDYGEYDTVPVYTPVTTWPCRKDPFSDFHAGFEIRTYRKCRRVIMYHSFRELNADGSISPVPVRSLDLIYQYDSSPADTLAEADFIISVTNTGYLQKADGSWVTKSLPPMTLQHQPLSWNTDWQSVSAEDAANAPQGLTGPYNWLDLWGEGLPGILTEQGGGDGWYYKQNLGNGHFTPAIPVATKPSFSGLGTTMQWEDLNADGRRQLVSRDMPAPGYFELDDNQQWQSFIAFKDRANIDWDSPFTKLLDLNGDGRPDALLAEDRVWTWYENEGTDGYTLGGYSSVFNDEERSPKLLFTDDIQSVFLADMNGDGLTDLVRIKNGEVSYWPNMGYGKFGARVAMSNAPVFDRADIFNPIYLTIADISGTGAADVIYIGPDNNCTAWINYAGNAFSPAQQIGPVPGTDPYSKIAVLDFLGNGTGCIVWSSPLLEYSSNPMRYIDLMGGNKPYLLRSYNNGLGKTTSLTYKSSALFYAEDEMDGLTWATRLPFPVQCVSQVDTADLVSQTTYSQSYRYHHGYYDHEEREFRGFGRVDTVDTDSAVFYDNGTSTEDDLDQSPVFTKTWYHTGAWIRESTLLDEFRKEYFEFDGWDDVTEIATFPDSMGAQENREAYRALKSSPLRQEVYALDGSPDEAKPYTVTAYAYGINMVQPLGANRYACFYNYQQQSIAFSCERNTEDPRIQHTLTTAIDEYGNVLEAAQVTYPRADTSGVNAVIAEVQSRMLVTYSVNAYTNDVIDNQNYLLRQPYEATAYQMYNLTLPAGVALWTPASVQSAFVAATPIAYTDVPGTVPEKRPISCGRTLYRDNNAVTVLPLGTLAALAISHNSYQLAFTDGILNDPGYYNGLVTDAMLAEGGYLREDLIAGFGSAVTTNYWLPGGTVQYSSTPTADFYSPVSYTDPWGKVTTITYWNSGVDNNYLLVQSVTDAVANTNTVLAYHWQTLQPLSTQDANDNISDILYDILGMPVATALRGKGDGTEGDNLDGIDADSSTDQANQIAFWAATDPTASAKLLLANATWRCMYDLTSQPVAVAMIAREQHYADEPDSNVLIRVTYTDGFGRVAMNKVQAAPDPVTTDTRWVGSGKTVYNNKGSVVLQYEPYFSPTHAYDPALQAASLGVSSRMYYDPLNRQYRAEMPNGTFAYTMWTSWMQTAYDTNDTVTDSTWYTARIGGAMGPEEQDAAQKAANHYNTPAVVHLDTLARPFYTVQHNRYPDSSGVWNDYFYESYVELDIQGNGLVMHDARNNTPLTFSYSILGVAVLAANIDSGTSVSLADAAGQAYYSWDADSRMFHNTFDDVRRPVSAEVLPSGSTVPKVLVLMVYGEGQLQDQLLNLRGNLYQSYDGAGTQTVPGYDFTYNPLSAVRQFVTDRMHSPDWTTPGSVSMEADTYVSAGTFDALGRPVTSTAPDGSVTYFVYEQGGQLFGTGVDGVHGLSTDIVNETYYNAKGQVIKTKYENGSTTTQEYDPETFRITNILTTRNSDNAILQDLQYWYDPVGNITIQEDGAQQPVYFDGAVASPDNNYTYDALYRLIIAQGRELAGNNSAPTYNDNSRAGITPVPVSAADTAAMRSYIQYYTYDAVGNMLQMKHTTTGGAGNWTRLFTVDTATNRLLKNSIGSNNPVSESYSYDARGNMIAGMNHLQSQVYNDENVLEAVYITSSITAYYQYNGSGQRVRKTIVDNGSKTVQVRKYVGGWEIYDKIDTATGSIVLERETLNMGGGALIDTPVINTTGSGEVQLLRYQYTNHLSTATLELDAAAAIITYEEYYPYGSTSFQSGRSMAEVSLKRYRYTGKEKDEETGLYYHGARYYAPWIARWVASDPMQEQMPQWSPYNYGFCNPVTWEDSTGMLPDDGGGGGGSVDTGSNIHLLDNHKRPLGGTPIIAGPGGGDGGKDVESGDGCSDDSCTIISNSGSRTDVDSVTGYVTYKGYDVTTQTDGDAITTSVTLVIMTYDPQTGQVVQFQRYDGTDPTAAMGYSVSIDTSGNGNSGNGSSIGNGANVGNGSINNTPTGREQDIHNMHVSAMGLQFLADHEGVKTKPYDDSQGYATIGVGHLLHMSKYTPSDVKQWQGFTENQAIDLLKKDIVQYEDMVKNLINVPLNQQQFDAIVSFTFNVGRGISTKHPGLKYSEFRSELNRAIYKGDLMMHYAKQKEVRKRREDEVILFNKGIYMNKGKKVKINLKWFR